MLERYRYDVFGKPFVSEIAGLPIPLENQGSTSALGNPHIKGGKIWDSDAGLFTGFGKDYVPDRDQFTNPGGDLWTVVDENDYNPDTNPNAGSGFRADKRLAAPGEGIQNIGLGVGLAMGAVAMVLTAPITVPLAIGVAVIGLVAGYAIGIGIMQELKKPEPKTDTKITGSSDGSSGGSGSNSGDSKDTETGGIDLGEDNGPNDQGSTPGAWAGGDTGPTPAGGGAYAHPTNPIWGDSGGWSEGPFYDPKPLAVFMHGSGGYTDPSQEDTSAVSSVIAGSVILDENATVSASQGGLRKPGGVTPQYGPNGEQSATNHSSPSPDPLYDPVPLI
jgi:hypothetical protein